MTVTPDFRLERIEQERNQLRAVFKNEFTGQPLVRLADHVIVEHGTLPADELFHELRDSSSNAGNTDHEALVGGVAQPLHSEKGDYELFRVGDAIACRNIHAAIYDSLRFVKNL